LPQSGPDEYGLMPYRTLVAGQGGHSRTSDAIGRFGRSLMPIAASRARWPVTASRTGSGGKAAPALSKWENVGHTGGVRSEQRHAVADDGARTPLPVDHIVELAGGAPAGDRKIAISA
jgi:hypothetical protein